MRKSPTKQRQRNSSRAKGSNLASNRAMAEGGNEPGTSTMEPEERVVVRNTLRELLFEIPRFRQLAEQGILPTLVARGGADGVGVATAESGRTVQVGEGGTETGRRSTPGLATSKEEEKREAMKREVTLSPLRGSSSQQ